MRVDRLDTEVKRILNTAAMAGASFGACLISTVVDGDTDAAARPIGGG